MSFIFIFIIYFLILLFYSWYNLIFNKNFVNFDIKNLYLDNIKTGDIFLLSNTKKNKIIADAIFNVKFYHPAIAFWENSNLFILEYAVYPTEQGLIKISFKEWLNFNKNKIISHKPLKIREEEEKNRFLLSSKISKFYDKNKKDFDKFDKGFSINNLRIIFRLNKKINFNNILCSEVITMILYESGIAFKNKEISYFKISDFIDMESFQINNNFSYPLNYLCNFQHLMKKYI
mgnify:CR=1 FL=1